ncbi:DUF4394 domain-containing protein [Streptomyces sp. CAU 1734]
MRRAVLTAALTAVLALVIPPASGASAQDTGPSHRGGDSQERGLAVLGLTEDQRLVAFGSEEPSAVRSLGRVTGLAGDTELVGIDFRVQDKSLYGVGDRGGVYTLDTTDAKAVKVSQLTVELAGSLFGVDFNPAANRLRVISDTGQNLRHNIDDAAAPLTTTVDGTLTNPTTPPSTALGVTGAAYTNNDLSAATATTLFDIDTVNDRVSLQSPANAGTLAPTGGLGVNAGPSAGFDIYYSPRTGTNQGYAALETDGGYRFFQVGLLNGTAVSRGAFPTSRQVFDIALPLDQP